VIVYADTTTGVIDDGEAINAISDVPRRVRAGLGVSPGTVLRFRVHEGDSRLIAPCLGYKKGKIVRETVENVRHLAMDSYAIAVNIEAL
jgi:hypothetical protein